MGAYIACYVRALFRPNDREKRESPVQQTFLGLLFNRKEMHGNIACNRQAVESANIAAQFKRVFTRSKHYG